MKGPLKDVEHLIRLAGLFAAGLLFFGVARAQFVPDDFGKYGHYRANAVTEAAAKPMVYAGRARCTECHEDTVNEAAPSKHKAIACETCHGALLKHADDPAVETTKVDAQPLCLRCHAANTGKPSHQPTVVAKDHSDEDSCVPCHNAHDPRMDQEK
ncbi:MAG TPA: multiheme c-type cytochrome [Vicinamibacterales bacterium]|jgi:cytochrome c554/c'-like protein|nr:multiheme c-type cytochrome [Vicinamibacterales bacterium]